MTYMGRFHPLPIKNRIKILIKAEIIVFIFLICCSTTKRQSDNFIDCQTDFFSLLFLDEVEKDFEKDVQHETGSLDRSSTDDAASQNNRGKSFNNAGERFQGWNYPHG